MTTKNANKAAQVWAAWLEEIKAAHAELAGIDLEGAQGERNQAEARAWQAARAGNELVDVAPTITPSRDDRDRVRRALMTNIKEVPEAERTGNQRERCKAWQQHHDAITVAEEALALAEEELADTQRRHDKAAARLAQAEAAQPDAGPQALEAIKVDRERLEAERDRIESALAGMAEDQSNHQQAQREAEQAQALLDDLEAQAALGEADESAQRDAATALAKARAKATKAKEAAERQASARRGLQRKLEGIERHAQELEAIRTEVGRRVHHEALAAAESRLLEAVKAMGLEGIVAEINQHRRDLEALTPDSRYEPARVRVTLPTFYAMPERHQAPEAITV